MDGSTTTAPASGVLDGGAVAPNATATAAATTTTRSAKPQIEGMSTVMQNEERNNKNLGTEAMTEAERSMREEELSFYSNSTNDHGDDNIWGLLSGVGGNIYEW